MVANIEGIQEDVYNVIREEVEPESTSLEEMPAEPRKKVKEELTAKKTFALLVIATFC